MSIFDGNVMPLKCWFDVCRADGSGSLQCCNYSEVKRQNEPCAISSFSDVDVLNPAKSRDIDSHIYAGDADADDGHSCGTRLSCILSDSEDPIVKSPVTHNSSSPMNMMPPSLPAIDKLRQSQRSFRVSQTLTEPLGYGRCSIAHLLISCLYPGCNWRWNIQQFVHGQTDLELFHTIFTFELPAPLADLTV